MNLKAHSYQFTFVCILVGLKLFSRQSKHVLSSVLKTILTSIYKKNTTQPGNTFVVLKSHTIASQEIIFSRVQKHTLVSWLWSGELVDLLERDRYAHELDVAVSVPDEQLRTARYVLGDLVVDLPVDLDGDEVLLLRVASAVDEGEPVAVDTSTVDEVTQSAVFEYLSTKILFYKITVDL